MSQNTIYVGGNLWQYTSMVQPNVFFQDITQDLFVFWISHQLDIQHLFDFFGIIFITDLFRKKKYNYITSIFC